MKPLLTLAALLTLAGCTTDNPTPTPTPSHTPSLQPGTAVPGARCHDQGARRATETGQTATCTHGPDGGTGGQRLEWAVTDG